MKLTAILGCLLVLSHTSHRKQAVAGAHQPIVTVAQHAEFSEQLGVAFARVSGGAGDACRPLPPIDCLTMHNYLIPPNSGYCGVVDSFVILCHDVPGVGIVYFDLEPPTGPVIREFSYGVP